MNSIGNKKQQEAAARKEIAKRWHLHDESELDSSSGSEVHCNIETSDESPVVTTRVKSKAQEAAMTTASPSQFEEGGEEPESDGDNPPTDNAKEGNDDAEELGDDDTKEKESSDKESAAKKSGEQVEDSDPSITPEARSKRWFVQGSKDVYYAGLALNEKGNPSCSIQEEPKIRMNALNKVPEFKRLFEGYNMHWMAKTLGKYNMEMVCEFYANYYYTLEKKTLSKNAIKKEPVLDSVRVRAIPVDISEWTITRVLMGGNYIMPA
ncbi:hypothetical protein HAX54_001202 [Datura stramonium]|uniref:Uncharacterized protein n=1 Tax=Datura stramonium TaxID=4076 RepID=A0ABS8WUG8_DATST|nr:hypothetical protein [Datura stramonium]